MRSDGVMMSVRRMPNLSFTTTLIAQGEVVVVDVGGKRLVLGVAPGQVSLLDQQEPSSATHDERSAVTATPDFAQWLKRTLARRNE